MNIILVSDLYYPLVNGCVRFTERLAMQLQARGHQVLVIAPSESFAYTKRVINEITVFGMRSVPTFVYSKFRVCFLPFSGKRIEQIIQDFQPDLIHFQWHFGVSRAVLNIATKQQIPTIATNHFMPETMVHYLPFSKWTGPLLIHYAWRDFAKIFEKMDLITTPTKRAAALIAPYFTKPIHPLSCGIDLNRFKPKQDTSGIRLRYHLPNRPILLYVGRLDKEKNIHFIIKAVKEALTSCSFHLVIAGTGALKKTLTSLVTGYHMTENVTFTGFIPEEDLPKLYCLADCFIIAGTAELQSIVTMEAMASSLPILAVNAVALPELVNHGENGFLFNATNDTELTRYIVRVFTDEPLRRAMGETSLALIAPHDITLVMRQFETLYAQIQD